MTKIIIIGCAGRMGKALVEASLLDNKMTLVGGTEYKGASAIGKDIGLRAGFENQNVAIGDDLEAILKKNKAIIIDFTTPEATLKNLALAQKYKAPIVIGTTGFKEDELKQISDVANDIPIVMAPNMSTGVNLLLSLVAKAASVLKDDYDIEVFEAHHKHKKDAPSGTAMKIAQVLCEETGRDFPANLSLERHKHNQARDQKEIGMQVLRAGDIVGEHTVFFCGEGERVEIKHVATSRQTFAKGAVRAAKWLSGKTKGLYSMQDVLGL